MIRRPLALVLALVHWSLSAQAQAPDDISVRSADQGLVQSALHAFERRDYPAALSLFKRASVTAPSLSVRLYLARTRVAMAQLVDAAADYSSVLAGARLGEEASSSERRVVAEARDELAQLRPASHRSKSRWARPSSARATCAC